MPRLLMFDKLGPAVRYVRVREVLSGVGSPVERNRKRARPSTQTRQGSFSRGVLRGGAGVGHVNGSARRGQIL